MERHLRPVIGFDEKKCTGCLRCIMKCPVKMCNDASKHGAVYFHADMCIGCGECLAVCDPKARYGLDDFDGFMSDAKSGVDMIALVAPAIVTSFDGMYLKFNGFLKKKLGLKAVFDASFGAELTVKSYLAYREKKKPKLIIAQPCPTLVSFIEMYHPSLIPHLAPVDSPLLHSMKMIRRFFPEYAKCKIAVISPCLAKRREFDATGHGDYNVTFRSIQDYLNKTNDRIAAYPETGYDGPAAERAVLFPSPGGLIRTIERYDGNASKFTKKVEGHPEVYHYLEYLEGILKNGETPLYPIIDCLSCGLGCNGGPGTLNQREHADKLLKPIFSRGKSAQTHHGTWQRPTRRKMDKLGTNFAQAAKLERSIEKYWSEGLYRRDYANRAWVVNKHFRAPSPEEIKKLHVQMRKTKPEDFLNCHACGYENCDQMAIACINGLNCFEHCRHYVEVMKHVMEAKHKEELVTLLARVHRITSEEVGKNVTGIASLSSHIDNSTVAIMNSFNATDEIVKGVNSIYAKLEESAAALNDLNASSDEGKRRLTQINSLVSTISEQSDALIDIAKIISNVADETNILGMNAAIQAAHAGDKVGRGFAVVAGQIRQLASNSSRQAGEIAKRLKDIKALIDDSHVSSNEAVIQFNHIVNLVGKVHENGEGVKGTVEVQTTSGQYAMGELNKLRETAAKIQEESDALMSSSQTVLANIDAIKNI